MAREPFSVGGITAHVVDDGDWDYPLDFLFPGRPEAQLRRELEGRLGPDGALHLPYGCLLLTTPTSRVLIDSGGGGALRPGLADIGVAPDDVDVVLLTHAHVDHISGLVGDGALAFPRARHVLTRAEWDAWTSEEVLSRLPGFLADPARDVLPRLQHAGVLDLVEGEAEVVPGVELVPAPGHTPGHTAVAIRSEGEQALLLADAVLDDMNLAHPEWASVPDMDPDETVATRLRLLDRVVADGTPVLGYHFAGVRQVERADGAYRFVR